MPPVLRRGVDGIDGRFPREFSNGGFVEHSQAVVHPRTSSLDAILPAVRIPLETSIGGFPRINFGPALPSQTLT